MKTIKIFLVTAACLFLYTTDTMTQNNVWLKTNGPYGGEIYSITSNSNDLFASTPNGIFHSTNNGISWTAVGFEDTLIYSIAIISSNEIIASSFDGWLYRSSDNGRNWTQHKIDVDVAGPVTQFVKNKDGSIFAGILFPTSSAIYRSTDNGITWTGTNILGIIEALAVNSKGHIFAAGGVLSYSSNNGDSWNTLDVGITFPNRIRSLLINLSDEIYVGVENEGVYRSTDHGLNWKNIGLNSMSVSALLIDSTGRFFAGTLDGIYQLIYNDTTWMKVNTMPGHTWNLCPGEGNNVFAGAGDGVYHTTFGTQWEAVNNGLSATITTAIVPLSNDQIIAGTRASGIFISSNNGENWIRRNNGLTTTYIKTISKQVDDYILTGTIHGVFRSTDLGLNWHASNIGLNNVSVLSFAFTNDGEVYAGTEYNGVYRSTNHGNEWRFSGIEGRTIVGFGINSKDDIFAANKYKSVYSLSKGDTGWTKCVIFEIYSLNTSIICTPNDFVFIGTSGNGIFRSIDDGDNWTPSNVGLNDSTVNTLTVDSLGTIYAGTPSGVYQSTDYGDTWVFLNSQIQFSVEALTITGNGQLLAGTIYEGIYQTMLQTSTHDHCFPLASDFVLHQNYPNPFNPSTVISYQLPVSSWVTLKVYDLLGREVAALINEEKKVGRYEVELNASTLSGGVYFYRLVVSSIEPLVAGNYVSTKKFVLIK